MCFTSLHVVVSDCYPLGAIVACIPAWPYGRETAVFCVAGLRSPPVRSAAAVASAGLCVHCYRMLRFSFAAIAE